MTEGICGEASLSVVVPMSHCVVCSTRMESGRQLQVKESRHSDNPGTKTREPYPEKAWTGFEDIVRYAI